MKWIAKGLLACVFGVISAVSAGAATVRYEFDVVDTNIRFQSGFSIGNSSQNGLLVETTPFRYASVPEGSPEYAAVLAIAHPLGALDGLDFSVTLDLELFNAGSQIDTFEGYGRISCVAGSICDGASGEFLRGYSRGVFLDVNPLLGIVSPYNSEGVFLQPNRLSLNHDWFSGASAVEVDGKNYAWEGEFASFTLENFKATLLPVPLPASSLLLSAGLIPLAAARRRKNRV